MALTPDPNPAAAPEAPASRRRSVWRRLWTWTWRSLVVVLLLIVLLSAALAWLGSGSGLRWLSSQPLQFGAVHLELQGIRGDVWGDLRIERLQLQSPRVDVHARDLHLRWNPRALLRQPRLVDVRLLSVSTLDLNLPPGSRSGPPKLPQSLALPLELRVARLHIGALRLGPPGARRPLGRFDASLRTRAGQVQLHAEASTPWGQGRARLTLGVARPFVVRGRLQATLHLRGARAPSSVQLDVRPSGSLQALRLQGMASALQTHVRFDAELAPFAALPLRSATIDAKHVDPARIDPKLPTALLDLQLDLQPSSAQRVRGSLKLSNARPGAINTKRLPLLGLQAVLDVQPGQVQVQQILARLPGGGTLSGSASYTTAKRASAPGLVAAPALLPASRPDTQPMAATAAAREDAHATDAAAPGDFRLDLQAGQIDMHALDSALLATRLSGPLHLHGNLQQQTLQARLTQPGWLAELRASRRGEHIDIARAVLQAQGGRLNASGSLDLHAPQRFAMHVVLEHVDPSRFHAATGAASASYPAADLNLKLQARGDAATRSAQVDLQVQPSRWRGHVFDGSARGQVSPAGVRGLQADLKLGSNSLKARGDFGRAGDLLRWTLDAPALAQIDPAFAGLAQASGTLAGTPAAPSGQFNLRVSRLTAPGKIQVQSLDASGQLQAGAQGQLKLHLKGSGITAGTFTLQRAEVDAAGRLDAQRIALRLRNADLDLSAALAGGYTAAQGWQGSIEQFSNRGRYAVDLLAPAPLLLAKNHLELQHARLRSAGGSLDLASAAWNAGQLDTTGSAQGVDPAYWLALFGADLHGVQSTLRFDADWSLHAANTLSGHVVVARSAGDVSLLTNPRLSLGLSQLRLQLQAKDDALSARFDATGGLFGSVHAEVQTQVSKHGRAWGVDAAAPLAGSLHADLPSIAWAAPLLGPTAKLGGKLLLDMKAAGSVAKPELRGALTGRALAVTLPAEGLNLQGGVLDAGFSGDTLELTRFSMQGGQGRLTASGKASFANAKPQASLQFSAQQLQVLNRPDRQAVVSGSGTLTLQGHSVELNSKLSVDSADFELPRGSAPKLASDVVVEGRPVLAPASSPTAGYGIAAVVEVDLGRDVHVTGYGLDAKLGGQLTLRAAPGRPLAAFGSIEVRKGTYSAYGQTLTLVRGGAVNFSGPIDSPGLNFSAQRDGLPVQVGVQVTGTLRAPIVTLTSTPVMPDSEILSWLVLGQDLTSASPNNLALLQTAAGALLASGQGAPVTSRVASALGLDQLSLSGQGGLQNSIVTLGKRITSKLSVSVERGLGTTGSLFNIRYDFTRRFYLRLQSGADSALDLFYTFRFD
ncbi:MAG: translocation/assembly module TamB domain-containing protein [Betaproteobacteria bacterium]|nr:translocation/assembly module TamB domain-containing protein [Betaproteobacteria bacterium]